MFRLACRYALHYVTCNSTYQHENRATIDEITSRAYLNKSKLEIIKGFEKTSASGPGALVASRDLMPQMLLILTLSLVSASDPWETQGRLLASTCPLELH